MESVANSVHLPPLDVPHEREAVGLELQAVLNELIALSLIGKHLHWSVVGPLSRSLHLYLDELVESWGQLADAVAERASALGFAPEGQAQGVASGSALAPVARGPIEVHDAVWELTRRVSDVAERVRSRLRPVGEVDLVTQGVLIDVVSVLEKNQWLLRVQVGDRT